MLLPLVLLHLRRVGGLYLLLVDLSSLLHRGMLQLAWWALCLCGQSGCLDLGLQLSRLWLVVLLCVRYEEKPWSEPTLALLFCKAHHSP